MTGTDERPAIKTAALDYIEGWYAGDSDRMERSLHPELVKRIQRETPDGQLVLEQMGAVELVGYTKQGGGVNDPVPRGDVEVLDVFGRAASVRVDAGKWVDFLHLIKTEDGWKILNVLWELRPAA